MKETKQPKSSSRYSHRHSKLLGDVKNRTSYKFISTIFISFVSLLIYSSAPVSRIAKYFRRDGTPLITVGGYTYDFVQNKTTCENEYHMLIRVGLLSFETIADFMVDIMKK